MDWDLIRTFCEMMKGGGLNAASERLHVSTATVSRRIKSLESALNQTLFAKTPAGYQPTEAAEEFYRHARRMETAAYELERRTLQTSSSAQSTVRLAAGNWLSWLIAREAGRFIESNEIAALEICNKYDVSSLSGNEADIALRNIRPERGKVVYKRYAAHSYFVYAAHSYADRCPDIENPEYWPEAVWTGLRSTNSPLPSSVWLAQTLGRGPDVACNQAMNVLDAVSGGAAIGLLPSFAGEAAGLKKLSGPIRLGAGAIWKVIHEDVYRRPAVREASRILENVIMETNTGDANPAS